jgi:hypothetical protein
MLVCHDGKFLPFSFGKFLASWVVVADAIIIFLQFTERNLGP